MMNSLLFAYIIGSDVTQAVHVFQRFLVIGRGHREQENRKNINNFFNRIHLLKLIQATFVPLAEFVTLSVSYFPLLPI